MPSDGYDPGPSTLYPTHQPTYPTAAPESDHTTFPTQHTPGAHGSSFVVAAAAPLYPTPSPSPSSSTPHRHQFQPYSFSHNPSQPSSQRSHSYHSYDTLHQPPSPGPCPRKPLRGYSDTERYSLQPLGYRRRSPTSTSQDYDTAPRRPSSLLLSTAMDSDRDPSRPDYRREEERYRYSQGRYDYEHGWVPHHQQQRPPPHSSHSTVSRARPPAPEQSPPPPHWSAPLPGSSGPSTSRHPAHPPASSYSPAQYPSNYPYPYPPMSHGEHAPPPQGGWPPWTSSYGGPAYPPASGPSRMHAGPSLSQPSPPPPASPLPIHRAPPPPPASRSPLRGRSSSPPSSGYLPGFQPDYDRARTTRRPSSADPSAGAGAASAVYGTDVRPPPIEAYLILRPHRVPPNGWKASDEKLADSSGWTYQLEVLQSPERGKALGVEALRRGWPALTPPLIVQLHVRDETGEELPTDHHALAKRLVHLTMSVELVSPDGSESRSMMRVRPPSPRDAVQPYYPTSAPPPYSVQRTLLGSSVRTPQILTREGQKGLYFIFQDMIVRPEGRYALEGKILDLAGPPHIGTSIGVTRPLAYCHTNPFDVIIPQEFPGPVAITALSTEFLRQGERHLGRRPRNEDGETDEADDGGNNE